MSLDLYAAYDTACIIEKTNWFDSLCRQIVRLVDNILSNRLFQVGLMMNPMIWQWTLVSHTQFLQEMIVKQRIKKNWMVVKVNNEDWIIIYNN